MAFIMPKDSQLDKKDVRSKKTKSDDTMAQSASDNGSRTAKKQSGFRRKANDDKK